MSTSIPDAVSSIEYGGDELPKVMDTGSATAAADQTKITTRERTTGNILTFFSYLLQSIVYQIAALMDVALPGIRYRLR
jgi:hypothetical protein